MAEFWTSVRHAAPYDTNILCLRENGNVTQQIWYDQEWTEFVAESAMGVQGKRCGGFVAWAEIPPFTNQEQGDG